MKMVDSGGVMHALARPWNLRQRLKEVSKGASALGTLGLMVDTKAQASCQVEGRARSDSRLKGKAGHSCSWPLHSMMDMCTIVAKRAAHSTGDVLLCTLRAAQKPFLGSQQAPTTKLMKGQSM
jgi:hypothetical protein